MAADVQPDQLRQRLRSGEDVFVLDVREPDEVAEWAFPGAVNIPLGQLGSRTGELPAGRPIVVVCHSGVRSAAAADALDKAGWPAENLAGGAVAWVSTEPDQA
ncbi:MAG TPA: rhodanese-like domain-containing protein [Acidimicrobiales bacterium]|nr:rhodanese-like domain-containing protein [Acidimicrobiales bacterium]